MRKAVVIAFVVFVVLTLSSQSTWAAGAGVITDGKTIFLPKGVPPAEMSMLTFSLQDLPKERQFMAGKVYKALFTSSRFMGAAGALQYVILTKWEKGGGEQIEFFFWPVGKSYKPFLDCTPQSDGRFLCTLRGRTAGNNWQLIFRGEKLSLEASDGYGADLEVIGTIPIQ